jgi:hypothetical protein
MGHPNILVGYRKKCGGHHHPLFVFGLPMMFTDIE